MPQKVMVSVADGPLNQEHRFPSFFFWPCRYSLGDYLHSPVALWAERHQIDRTVVPFNPVWLNVVNGEPYVIPAADGAKVIAVLLERSAYPAPARTVHCAPRWPSMIFTQVGSIPARRRAEMAGVVSL